MSTTTYSVIIIIIVAGAVVWFLIPSSMDFWSNTNDTDQTTAAPAPKLSTKAWIFDSEGENLTVIEFDPVTKSVTSLQQPNPFSGDNQEISTQNNDYGILVFNAESSYMIDLFDKKEKNVFGYASNSWSYDSKTLGISGERAILLSSPAENSCQSINILSPRKNEVIEANLPMDVCRFLSYCMASMSTGDVYVFGGYNYTGTNYPDILASEKYSAESNTMQSIADLPGTMPQSGRPYCKTSEYHGDVMVCDNDAQVSQSCYLYHPEGNTWGTVGGFVKDRKNYELVVVGNDLFAVGGLGEHTIERYNEDNKSWKMFMTDVSYIDAYDNFAAFSM